MALKRVKYIREDGPPAVDVAGLGIVKRGETIELPEEMAAALVEQRPKHFAIAKSKGPDKGGITTDTTKG